jgi:hypothetical protein
MPIPFLTTVRDVLFTPEGVLVTSGSLTISNPDTFLSADSFTILQGFNLDIPVVDGAFSVPLIPNEGTSPASTYNVSVRCTQGTFAMVWAVPNSDTTVNLSQVVVS